MTTEHERRDGAVQAALSRVESTLGANLLGGNRVAVKSILTELYDVGMIDAAWTPVDNVKAEPAKPGTMSMREPQKQNWVELRQWWVDTAASEIEGLVSKMEEYGGATRATDLTEIGEAMVMTGVPVEVGVPGTESWRQELGIYFYLRGKFARWGAAIKEGRRVSDDTLHDIAIYTRMAQRIRKCGGWPV